MDSPAARYAGAGRSGQGLTDGSDRRRPVIPGSSWRRHRPIDGAGGDEVLASSQPGATMRPDMTKRLPPRGDTQPDLFAATFADIPIRDQRDTMERPFFSLAKKPRLAPIEYRVGDVWVEVTANPNFGLATIWDADILIWAATQLTEARDRGREVSRVIRFHPHNLLKSIRRDAGGVNYKRLRAALDRLTHTAVRTNIRAQGKKKFASFHWLAGWTEVTDEASGETLGMTMTLPDWLF